MLRKTIKIILQEPLDKETIDQLIKQFDDRNISRDSNGWWGTTTEKDKPSYKDNIKIKSDGTICLEGVDFTEGKILTYLDIAGNRKSINVDQDWNCSMVGCILDERKIEYQVKRPL